MKPLSRPLIVLAGLALLFGACAASAQPTWTYAPLGDPPAEAPAQPAQSASPQQPVAEPDDSLMGRLEFRGFDLGFEPADMSVDAPGRYEVVLINDGAIPHDIAFPDGTVIYAAGGETASGEVTIPAEGLEFICSIPGHADAGMTGAISVEGGAAPGASPSHDPDDHGGPPPETGIEPDPDAPAPVRYDPAAPALAQGELHELELIMTERPMTVAPGYVQQVWTFGDEVPGPVLRVKVGDTIRVRLVNSPDNQLPHSLDFHSSMVAWNDEMRSINPGEELIYEWVANHAGVWMYHCGTSPALHHIANGMYGMVIVEPEGGLDPVEHEFAFVQSEWYLGQQGQPTDLAKAMKAAPEPDFVVFNGVANQYADGPIEVATGERVRVFVLNAGPSVDSSFHIVGTIFDRVIKEGVELERDNPGRWGAQAVDLAPAQGAIVEFVLAEDGLYPMVTHAFNFVGRGALGIFQAGDGDPAN
ncbi:MAG TPA: multicopper oxidase domain-containing protein [Candidatus Limnocylindria bacterium]|nr:multicopper oxidase domain-containing protein [Candidatus Limnocylindria bacterium]